MARRPAASKLWSWTLSTAALALLGAALCACGGRQPCGGPVHEIDRSPPAASATSSGAPR